MAEHDPKLVEDLAEVIGGDHWWECDHFNESSEDGCKVDAVRAALDWLAERGRLLPSGGEVSIQWGVRSVAFPNNRARAVNEAQARQWLGGDLSTVVGMVELIRQSVTTWPDGTKLVGPWSPVLSDNSEKGAGDGSEA